MARKNLSREIKNFVRWAQNDRCFLCSFPLAIYCHLHHIISIKDYGPDHYLNLIGLCANHHGMLENMKRTRNPSFSIIGTDHPEMLRWLYKNQAAMNEFEALAPERRKVMDKLLAPYWQSGDSLCGIFEKQEPLNKVILSKMVMKLDIELLDMINSMRPRIFFPKPTITATDRNPYDILLMDQAEFQTTIDQFVGSNLHNIGKEKYDIAITLHLLKLNLPGSFHKNDEIFRFQFSTEMNFSLRELSDYQIYGL